MYKQTPSLKRGFVYGKIEELTKDEVLFLGPLFCLMGEAQVS
jgi:hypothetical protein